MSGYPGGIVQLCRGTRSPVDELINMEARACPIGYEGDSARNGAERSISEALPAATDAVFAAAMSAVYIVVGLDR